MNSSLPRKKSEWAEPEITRARCGCRGFAAQHSSRMESDSLDCSVVRALMRPRSTRLHELEIPLDARSVSSPARIRAPERRWHRDLRHQERDFRAAQLDRSFPLRSVEARSAPPTIVHNIRGEARVEQLKRVCTLTPEGRTRESGRMEF